MENNNPLETIEVKQVIRIGVDSIAALLCNAFEGGYADWCQIIRCNEPHSEVKFEKHANWSKLPRCSWPLGEGGYVSLINTLNNETYTLDRSSIETGLEIMCNQYQNHFEDFVEGRSDGITGDVFLQCCVLGTVDYWK